jgi:hypothetical protein
LNSESKSNYIYKYNEIIFFSQQPINIWDPIFLFT